MPSGVSREVPVEAVRSFVPEIVARRYAGNGDVSPSAATDELDVILLECDLSGFTSFAERFAKIGPAGTEQVSAALSEVFGGLSRLVIEHGGDVIEFAGDAVLALWEIGDLHQREALQRVCVCALEMQGQLRENQVASEHGLTMRAGIATGKVTVYHLGGVGGRWDVAIAGEPVTQVGRAQGAAESGGVSLSPEARRILSGELTRIEGPTPLKPEEIGSSTPPVAQRAAPISGHSSTSLAAYVPGTVIERLAAGQSSFLAELRRLTVMFVELPILASTAEVGPVQDLVVEIQTVLSHYEGSFHKLSVDDKGAKLVGIFGLPPMSHEDDPARAVLAGREIARSAAALGARVSVGVATGRAFSGLIGGTTRREFTVIGDVVNLSARLMGAAQGGVLCDEETYRAAQVRVTFRASRPIAIKGKADPVTAYSPTGEHADDVTPYRTLAGGTTQIVGRRAEMMVLDGMLTSLATGHGEVTVIEGEAGIGKSRLVEYLLDEAEARGFRCFIGAGDAIESSAPYRAWRPIMLGLLGLESGSGYIRTEGRKRLDEMIGGVADLERLTPLVNAIVNLDIPENTLTETMSAEARADNIQLLVTHLVEEVSGQAPTVLVFDDAQWLDPSSWQLVRDVLSSISSLGAAVATRPPGDPVPTEYAAFVRTVSPQVVPVGPLGSEEITYLVCNTLGIGRIQSEVMELLNSKAEGHPMFSKELAYYLRNEGLVVAETSTSSGRLPSGVLAPGADLSDVQFPDTVQVVITTRIDRLAVRQQLMLKVASVIGREFEPGLLRAVLPLETTSGQFDADLERLVAAELIEPTPEGFAFRHAIIQDVAYGLLPFADRRDLHRDVALWHEENHSDNLEPYLPVLAHHWTAADIDEKAIHYQALSGEQALANYANEEAITYLGTAIDIAQRMTEPVDTRTLAKWELHIGAAYIHWSRYTEGRHHLEQGLGLLGHPVPTSSSAISKGWRLLVALIRQWRSRVFGGRRGERDPRRRSDLLDASRGYTRLVEAAFLSGDQWLAVYSAFHALNLAERTNASAELAEAYGPVGVIYGSIPLRGEASRYLGKAVQTARDVDSPSALGYALLAHGTYSIGAADWDAASAMASDLVDLGRRYGARKRLNDGLQSQTFVHYLQGHFAEVLPVADELEASARRGHDPRFLAYAHFAKGYASLFLGRFEEALGLLDDVEGILGGESETSDRMLELMRLGVMSAVLLRLGRVGEARATAVEALDRQLGAPLDLGFGVPGYSMPADVLLEISSSDPTNTELRSDSDRATQSLKKFARLYQVARPHHRLAAGSLAMQRGRAHTALRSWRAAASIADELRMPFVAGQAHLRLAEHTEDATESVTHGDIALRIFAEQQTPYELGLAREIMEGRGERDAQV